MSRVIITSIRLYLGLMSRKYDVIVIGTGAGGGTLALHLAQAGKKILILERGPFMPQEKLNWDTNAVFLDNRYHTKETWQDKDGKDLHPQQAYFVGGQTKVYGAAMFRLTTRAPKNCSMCVATSVQRLPFPVDTARQSTPRNPSTRRSTRIPPFPMNPGCRLSRTTSGSWGSIPFRCLWD